MSTGRGPDYDVKTDETPLPASEQRRPTSATLKPNEARGGVTHHNVRYVLGISLTLIVVAFALIYFVFIDVTPPDPT